ncbi:MAG: AraC family transcriptional regulator [Bacteroidetes bacterium]|nr:AraC family transcriptional regulator [Bacteroidota bacterium]MBS1630974.1 AraC family transcriptional regulator [Bacteroidota bacterium]
MIGVKYFPNDSNNKWLIRQFEEYRFSDCTRIDKFIPRPNVSVIFHFGDRPKISGNNNLTLEPFFVAPVIPHAIITKFQGDMDTLVIVCRATVFSRLFDLDMTPVPKRSISLPNRIFLPVWKSLRNLSSTPERIAWFSEFINNMQPGTYYPDAVDSFYEKIIQKCVAQSLKEIMPECFASKSTLLRKFIRRTGVNPKTLARIARLDHLWKMIKEKQTTDSQSLALEGNFFDQAHFINDFKNIIGETPGVVLKRYPKSLKMSSGMLLLEM